MWKQSFWGKDNPVTSATENFQQNQSGEDWFNKHILTKNVTGAVDGMIMAGYSDFANFLVNDALSCPTQPGYRKASWTHDCKHFESSTHRRGTMFATLAKYGKDGQEIWFKTFGYTGEYNSVIQTANGGYLAIGVTHGLRDFKNGVNIRYNPKTGYPGDLYNPGNPGCGNDDMVWKWIVTRTDASGNVLWTYLYGVPQFSDGAERAVRAEGFGYTAVELPNGKFLLGGYQVDPDYTQEGSAQNGQQAKPTERAAIIQIDANGNYEWGEYLLPNNANSVIYDFELAQVNGSPTVFAAGTEGYPNMGGTMEYQPGIVAYYRKKAFLAKFDPAGTHNDDEGVFTQIFYPGYEPSVKQNMRVTDIAVNNAGNILFPVIRNTHDLCFSWNCKGDGAVYTVNSSSGVILQEVLLTDPNNANDKLKAYDLRIGITPTSTGGFAIVSSRQPNAPLQQGPGLDIPDYGCNLGVELKYFETDALVAKYSAGGALIWKTSFDAGEAALSPPGSRYGWPYPDPLMRDLKNGECVYSITELPDQSLIISGNNSSNFDDYYVAKIFGGGGRIPALNLLLLD